MGFPEGTLRKPYKFIGFLPGWGVTINIPGPIRYAHRKQQSTACGGAPGVLPLGLVFGLHVPNRLWRQWLDTKTGYMEKAKTRIL